MPKSNGAHALANPLEGLRAQVGALQARQAQLSTGRSEVAAQLDRLTASRPTLAAAAHVEGKADAREQLKALNAEALDLESALTGFDFELEKARTGLADLTEALAQEDQLRRIEHGEAAANQLAAQIDAALKTAAARWADFQAARDAVRALQAQRVAALGSIADAMRTTGAPDGHAWPPSETIRTVEARLAELTAA